MDKDKKEKERLFQWACRNSSKNLTEKIFPCIDKNEDSYFERCNKESDCLREYAFQELPELKEELEHLWDNEECMNEIMVMVLAGAFKNQIEINEESSVKRNDSFIIADELPPYIYGF